MFSTETSRCLLDTFHVGASQTAGFHDLWVAHARDVHRFAVYLSGNSTLADDLTSEAFLRVWDAWDRVAFPTVRSYLFATVRNLYLHQLRRFKRERPILKTIPTATRWPSTRSRKSGCNR